MKGSWEERKRERKNKETKNNWTSYQVCKVTNVMGKLRTVTLLRMVIELKLNVVPVFIMKACKGVEA